MNKNRIWQVSAFIDLIVSLSFLIWYLASSWKSFLFGYFCAIPISWAIPYYIFFNTEKLGLGQRLQILNKITPYLKFLLIATFIWGYLGNSGINFQDAIFDGGDQSSAGIFSLSYFILTALLTQLSIAMVLIKTLELATNKNFFIENNDISWRKLLGLLTTALPLIILILILIYSQAIYG